MGVGRGFRVNRDRELRCEVRLSRSMSGWSVSGGSGGRNVGDSNCVSCGCDCGCGLHSVLEFVLILKCALVLLLLFVNAS